MDVRVQRVVTTWTKVSRGGAAARRNSCPVAFAWPGPGAVWHEITMDEEHAFKASHTSSSALPDDVYQQLGFREQPGRLSMLPQLSAFWMPKRHRRPPSQSLAPGQWLRWTINYRVGLDDGWRYGLVTINVANQAPRPPDDLFLGTPDAVVDETASLR